mgnify:CR=1 FL=1
MLINYNVVSQVKRRPKAFTKLLRIVLVTGAILNVIMGVAFDRGFMLTSLLFAALYMIYDIQSVTEYEYMLEGGHFRVDRIKGYRYRKAVQFIKVEDIIVIAPPDDKAVAAYKKNGTEKVKKYDYTSYEPGVVYYTMIAKEGDEKIKLLLDLNDQMLETFRRIDSRKVILY